MIVRESGLIPMGSRARINSRMLGFQSANAYIPSSFESHAACSCAESGGTAFCLAVR